MVLNVPKPPLAGSNFSVQLDGYTGAAKLAVYVAGQRLLEKDCPDPPCHEMVFLTRDLAGRELKVIGTAMGESVSRTFRIETKKSEGGAMMAG